MSGSFEERKRKLRSAASVLEDAPEWIVIARCAPKLGEKRNEMFILRCCGKEFALAALRVFEVDTQIMLGRKDEDPEG